jgi:hypothetical protein
MRIAVALAAATLTTPGWAQVRVFMAPEGEQANVPTSGNTMITMDPGTTTHVVVWMEDANAPASGQQLNAYQLIWPWTAFNGTSGTVTYVDNNPGLGNGNSLFVDVNRLDWVFEDQVVALPVNYNETPDIIFGVFYATIQGLFTVPAGQGIKYLADFDLVASADACGTFEMRFNLPPKSPPLSALFNPFGAAFTVNEWQALTVEVVCKGGCQDPCDDGNACTVDDACDGDVCVGTPVDCSGQGDTCNAASCDPAGAEGNCDTLTPLKNGTPCDDGDACTTSDACLNGTCSGPPVDCSNLDDDCNVGVCDPATGQCQTEPANEGGPCDDGDLCTSGDTCSAGTCSSGSPVDCSFLDDECNVGVCDPGSGKCTQEPANEGGPCEGGTGTCVAGDCVIEGECTTNEECDDGIACTVDTCDLAMGGVCMHAPDNGACDDGLACTDDVCDRSQGCLNTNTCPAETPFCTPTGCVECIDSGDCQDSDACTLNEACTAGQCTSDTVDCSTSGDDCNTASCDPAGAAGNCDILTPLPDGTLCMGRRGVCMNGQCVPSGECQTDEMCDDGVACTLDSCSRKLGNICVHEPQDESCDDGLFCNGAETCDPLSGCQPGTPPCAGPCNEELDQCEECVTNEDCDDGVACTVDTCTAGSCSNAPDNGLCDDGLFCNGEETCDRMSGCQAGTPPCAPGSSCNEELDQCGECATDEDCEDDISCTVDTCVAGACAHEPSDDLCQDGLACNGQETCDPNSGCEGGDPVLCDPGEVCAEPAGVCVPAPEGCFRTLVIKGGACPSPYNPSSSGVLPVDLVGDEDFDVTEIDLSSLELRRCDGIGGAAHPLDGPPGPGTEFVDQRSPNDAEVSCADGIDCACEAEGENGPDGFLDLKLKFNRPEITNALQLDEFSGDDIVVLELSGVTESGESFCARDCIRIVGGGGHRD